MKIERFKYHEKFCVKSTFLDTSIDVEGVLEDGETLQEGVAKARIEMMKALPVNPLNDIDLGWGKGVSAPPKTEITFGPAPVIDYGKHSQYPDDVMNDINAAASIEALTTFKLLANSDPLLRKAYMDKLRYLTETAEYKNKK